MPTKTLCIVNLITSFSHNDQMEKNLEDVWCKFQEIYIVE